MAQRKTASPPPLSKSATLNEEALAWWWHLPREQRRGYLGIAVGFITFLALIGTLPFAQHSWLALLAAPMHVLLGWGALPALMGTLVLCGILIRDAFTGQAHPYRLTLICLGVALLLILTEMSLLFGPPAGGWVGALGAHFLGSLTAPVAQLCIWGGLGIDLLVLFRVSWRDVVGATQGMRARRDTPPVAAPPLAQPAPMAPQGSPATHPHTISGEVAAILAGMPRAPLPERAPRAPSPPPLDYTDDALLDALRVPAYLRRDTGFAEAAPPAVATTTGEFALPPLPVAPRGIERTTALPALSPRPATPPPPPAPVHDREIGITRVTRRAASLTWRIPALSMLNPLAEARAPHGREHAERLASTIARTLKSFGVEAEVRSEDISIGPTVLRFGVRPTERVRKDDRGRVMVDANGDPIIVRTRVNRILNLKNDLALALEVKTLRMEAPVPERPYIGIEIPNTLGQGVNLREVLASREYRELRTQSPLAFALGRDVAGKVRVGDLARFPHLLIAGATGSGKSVCLSAIIGSLISHATPDEVRLLLIDPKMVELTLYAGIPHLLAPVITDPAQAGAALAATLDEMTRRYTLFHQHGVRHIAGYDALRAHPNGESLEKLPRIVVVIDELADLMMQARDEIEEYICRLAQLARATGIHLVVATQRPSVDVITGLIKANIATRIAFMVSSGTDARTIMDGNGAEQLLGKGDMLFQSDAAPKPERIQGAYVGDDEIARLADFWSNQATKLGVVPAQWDLTDTEDDGEEDVLVELRRRTRGAAAHTRKR